MLVSGIETHTLYATHTCVSYNFDCPVIMLFILPDPESCATRGRHSTKAGPGPAARSPVSTAPRRNREQTVNLKPR